jgi:putative acetyltransferase
LSKLGIRESIAADAAAIELLYQLAFPDEDLVPLVRSLLREPAIATSLVAVVDSRIVGHAIFTSCTVHGSDLKVVLLGPLAVAPTEQRKGIGTELVECGLESAGESGADLVCVLGDPAYYGRLGFTAEAFIEPPYPLPPEWAGAWQSQYLTGESQSFAGKLAVPRQWRDPALWGP